MADKFKAVWLSHSSIRDFLNCPRLYYLRAIYKDPISKHKITIIEPPLTLGQVVHDTIDSISLLPQEERGDFPLLKKYDSLWEKIKGERGGFRDSQEEDGFYQRGKAMIENLQKNISPLLKKAVKIPEDLPWYWLSEEENLILSGKIDWLIYKEETDSVHILDFKTGKRDEPEDSLQLPIYLLVVKNTQKREVSGASYWYLERDQAPRDVLLPEYSKAQEDVFSIGRRIKLARQLEHFVCPSGGCRYCLQYEEIIKGKGKKVGLSNYNQDLYILQK